MHTPSGGVQMPQLALQHTCPAGQTLLPHFTEPLAEPPGFGLRSGFEAGTLAGVPSGVVPSRGGTVFGAGVAVAAGAAVLAEGVLALDGDVTALASPRV